MNISLQDRNALVCGGSKGIGRAIAFELAELGANVYLLSRSENEMKQVVESLPMKEDQTHGYMVADLLETEALKATLETLAAQRTFHILINNTGGPKAGPLTQAGIEELYKGFSMHVVASQLMAQYLVPGMMEAGYGRIINIISTSVKEPIPGLGVSNTIRGAMGNWAKTLAGELGPTGITVNNILPGFTATGRLDAIIETRRASMNKTREEMENIFKSVVPLGRFADPSEVAQVAAFIASPAASYVSGINIPVDGGRTKSL